MTVTEPTTEPTQDHEVPETSADVVAEDVVAEELLVEEISIDGMCGVY